MIPIDEDTIDDPELRVALAATARWEAVGIELRKQGTDRCRIEERDGGGFEVVFDDWVWLTDACEAAGMVEPDLTIEQLEPALRAVLEREDAALAKRTLFDSEAAAVIAIAPHRRGAGRIRRIWNTALAHPLALLATEPA